LTAFLSVFREQARALAWSFVADFLFGNAVFLFPAGVLNSLSLNAGKSVKGTGVMWIPI